MRKFATNSEQGLDAASSEEEEFAQYRDDVLFRDAVVNAPTAKRASAFLLRLSGQPREYLTIDCGPLPRSAGSISSGVKGFSRFLVGV